MTSTNNDLVALLNDARQELAVLASHLDHPDIVWPTVGLKVTAKAHKALVERIDAWLAEPVEELPLRQENFALRAALAVQRNDEEWRLKYLEAEGKRVNAVLKAESHEKAWYSAKQEFGAATAKLREQLAWQAACTKALMESQEQQASEIKRLRDALEGMVNLCRLDCSAESNCRVCAVALRAIKGES